MFISLNKLEKILSTKLDIAKTRGALTMAGLEVQDVIHYNFEDIDEKIIVAKIISIDKHPDADRLTVCKVDNGKESLQVICGADNINVGNVVPLATIGAKLNKSDKHPEGLKIKEAKIRGVESFGMLCSLDELDVNHSSSDGIFILPSELKIGSKLCTNKGLEDYVLDVSITPNRGDCLSFYGIARELSAILKLPFSDQLLNLDDKQYKLVEKINELSVDINSEDAIRYSLIKIEDIVVVESPFWIKDLLSKLNTNSINNVVDLSNLFMFLTGHPIHIFDFDEIDGDVIRISNDVDVAFKTLDGNVRDTKNHLTIADAKGPIALAGIIGGERASVTNKTTNILLECASFDPSTIRSNSKSLNVSTESSYRFERRVSEYLVKNALLFAAELLVSICGGKIIKEYIDTNPTLKDGRLIELNLDKVSRTLGLSIAKEEVVRILASLSIEQTSENGTTTAFSPPSYRFDLANDYDLIEEVARTVGLDSIPATFPRVPLREKILNPFPDLRDISSKARELFSLEGFSEVINYSFTDDEIAFPNLNKLAIMNPHSQDAKFLRTSLIPSLLKNAVYNLNRNSEIFKFFEIGNTFTKDGSNHGQHMEIGVISSHEPSNPLWKKSKEDFFDLKNSLLKLFAGLRLDVRKIAFDSQLPADYNKILHPGKSSMIYFEDSLVGYIGDLHPEISGQYGIEKGVILAGIFVDQIAKLDKSVKTMRPFGTFPFIQRDLSIIIDKNVQSRQVIEVITSLTSPIIKDTFVFDLFHDPELGDNKKSLSLSVIFGANDRTLQDDEVSSIFDKVVVGLKKEVAAEIRE
ncbi:MAG: phenylalanine--tRNA ligase subunit beta [Spirochaetales bacterium]|jgi:phenylalanyl-tRNA synthetase beta chain|nr:phenylalanine--tRNA ligase subunit beta [Spirochaetales bacterium]|tara:strand:- start:1712 stop:4135 length:2424 start_codon:yes stop_codon:yes gene_type:complete